MEEKSLAWSTLSVLMMAFGAMVGAVEGTVSAIDPTVKDDIQKVFVKVVEVRDTFARHSSCAVVLKRGPHVIWMDGFPK